jgi:glycosyltransferase involved in cell wall biosynthesis
MRTNVSFHPGLSREAMRDLLQTLDVFVLPSHQEGLCIAALEAMACGLPVVSTRCGGPEEFVIPGVSGELVESRPESVAAAVKRLIKDESERAALSSSARRLVEERYSAKRARSIFTQEFRRAFPAAPWASSAAPEEKIASA